MSKSRVALIKMITLPKLELMAAVMATRLVKFVRSSLHLQTDSHIHMWTDSQIVLHWIYKSHKSNPFISHRVAEIVGAFSANVWSYTPSSDNPANLLTRGISAQQLFSSELWLQGPQWLRSRNEWPQWIPSNVLLQLTEDGDCENTSSTTQINEDVAGIHNIIDIAHFNTINKLVAVTAYVLRYLHNTRKKQPRLVGPLTSTELITARKKWISSSQSSSYSTELAYLLKRQQSCPNLVRQLRFYLDNDKLIRCGGRIYNAPCIS